MQSKIALNALPRKVLFFIALVLIVIFSIFYISFLVSRSLHHDDYSSSSSQQIQEHHDVSHLSGLHRMREGYGKKTNWKENRKKKDHLFMNTSKNSITDSATSVSLSSSQFKTSTSTPSLTSSTTSSSPDFDWSPTKSKRIICVDIDPDLTNPRNVKLFDYKQQGFSMFHACQIREAWISGTFSTSGEAHLEQVVIFPPAPSQALQPATLRRFPRTKYDFPKTPFNTPYTVIVEEQDDNVERRELKFGNDGKRFHVPASNNNQQGGGGNMMMNLNNNVVQNNNPNQEDYDDPHRQLLEYIGPHKFVRGTTLVVSPHYCCKHPVHFLEPLGAVASALDRWLPSSCSSSSKHNQQKEEEECIDSISQILIFSAQGLVEGFNMHVTKSVVFGAFQRAGLSEHAAVKIPVTSVLGQNFRYDRLLFFGARYDIWPTSELAVRFVSDFHRYLEYRLVNRMAVLRNHNDEKDFEVARQYLDSYQHYATTTMMTNNNNNNNNNKTGDKNNDDDVKKSHKVNNSNSNNNNKRNKKKKKIIYMKRGSGRKITDQDKFIDFLRHSTSLLSNLMIMNAQNENKNHDAEEESVEEEEFEIIPISATSYTVDELRLIIKDAKLMISIHGADLANMLFLDTHHHENYQGSNITMKKKQERSHHRDQIAILEINPLFFFEPRFYDMSRKLGVNYFSYNCASPKCAFGGNRLLFRANFPLDVSFDEFDNHRLTYKFPGHYDDDDNEKTKQGKKRQELTAHWPISGYVGETCGRPCLDMIDHTSIQYKFYSSFRGSDVAITHSTKIMKEFGGVMFDALVSVGWAKDSLNLKREFLSRID